MRGCRSGSDGLCRRRGSLSRVALLNESVCFQGVESGGCEGGLISLKAVRFANSTAACRSNEGSTGPLICLFKFLRCPTGSSFSVLVECQPALVSCYFCIVITLSFNFKNQLKLLLTRTSHLARVFCVSAIP